MSTVLRSPRLFYNHSLGIDAMCSWGKSKCKLLPIY